MYVPLQTEGPSAGIGLEKSLEHFLEDADRIHIIAARLNNPFPDCDSEGGKENGTLYTQLGAVQTLQTLRSKLAGQFACIKEEIRRIRITLTGYEGVTQEGCPVAKWVIRRSNHKELNTLSFIKSGCQGTVMNLLSCS